MAVVSPFVSFFSAALVLVPLPWHIRARNVATVSIITWLFLVNIIYGVDSIVWAGNVQELIPVWCDITSNIITGFNVGVPAACLCICIHLERIASFNQSSARSAKYRRIIFEVSVCFLLPAVYMCLHYIVQGRRYDIFEDFGCRPNTYVSLPVVFLMWIPPLVLTSATVVFAALALRHFLHHGIQISRRGTTTNSALTPSRYIRLIAMSALEMVWATIFTSINIRYSLLSSSGLQPWTGWTDVHSDSSRVGLFPTADTPTDTRHFLTFMWWTVPVSSVLFFAFFGLGEEAMNEYKGYWRRCRRLIIRKKPGPRESILSTSQRKSFVPAFTDPAWSTFRSQDSQVNYSPSNSRSHTPLPPAEKKENDDVSFMSATISYLQSPTGRSASALASSHRPNELLSNPKNTLIPLHYPELPPSIPTRPPRPQAPLYELQPCSTPPWLNRQPFDGAMDLPMGSRDANSQSGLDSSGEDVIYMTVVKEIV